MNLADLNNLDLKDLSRAPLAAKGAALAFIFLAIVGIGYWMDWSPSLEALKKAEAQEKSLRETFATKKRQALHYQAYKQRLADTEKALAALLRQLPNKSEMDDLLADINQTGIGRGLEFDLFRPGTETVSEFYATLPVTLRVNGGYHDLGNFVSDAARLPRIVTIHDINLAPAKDGKLSMQASVRTYRYLDEEEMSARSKAAQAEKDARAKKGTKR
jgi:type IV pilus assembly protein PilO